MDSSQRADYNDVRLVLIAYTDSVHQFTENVVVCHRLLYLTAWHYVTVTTPVAKRMLLTLTKFLSPYARMGYFQAALEMWVLHKILSSNLCNSQPQSHFVTVCPELFWQNLTSRPQKFSTEEEIKGTTSSWMAILDITCSVG